MLQIDLKEVKAIDLLQEEAIAFGEFIEKWGWCKPLCENGGWINDLDEKVETSEKLYKLFKDGK